MLTSLESTSETDWDSYPRAQVIPLFPLTQWLLHKDFMALACPVQSELTALAK